MISQKDVLFRQVTIIGVGLIGASFALALKEKGLSQNVCGYGRREENLRNAKERKIIDRYEADIREACENSDLILLATPPGAFKGVIEKIRGIVKTGGIVTDVGSVKGRLVGELEALMPQRRFYVGSHPIAGSDRSGIDNARADLFKGARCIITPTDRTDREARDKVSLLWQLLGAVVEVMDPLLHDEIYATVSHLPHIIAYTLVNTVENISPDHLGYAGQGFKDATRIALSAPALWRDISLLNRENLLEDISVFRENLERVRRCLEDGDAKGLEKAFEEAQRFRMRLK